MRNDAGKLFVTIEALTSQAAAGVDPQRRRCNPGCKGCVPTSNSHHPARAEAGTYKGHGGNLGVGFCVMSADAFVPTPTSKTIVLFRLRMKAQGTSAFAPQTTKPSDRRASTARPSAQCSAPTRTSRAVRAARASQASHKAIAISRISHDNIHNCTLSDSPSGHLLSKRHVDTRISSKSVPPRQEA